MNREELEAYTVDDLKEMLSDQGLATNGKKADLIDRLLGDSAPAAQDMKENDHTWWCPNCDTSYHKVTYPDYSCAACGWPEFEDDDR